MHIVKTNLRNFSAAHRLVKGYRGKCQNLHGHDYAVKISLGSKTLNEFGFVVDFLDVKKYCNQWIQEHWDHGILLCEEDKSLLAFAEQEQQKYYVLPNNCNSTAEVLAEFLFHQLTKVFEIHNHFSNPHARLLDVGVWESEESGAIFGVDNVAITGNLCGS